VLIAGLLAFLTGYLTSSHTGVEPGFFDAVETGSYGGKQDEPSTKGLNKGLQDYYKNLSK